MFGLVFTNNLIVTGQYPVWDADGGSGDCAQADIPITNISTCFTTFTFSNNGLITPPPAYPRRSGRPTTCFRKPSKT